jgi:transitional endoplasmic reticulum ATPase
LASKIGQLLGIDYFSLTIADLKRQFIGGSAQASKEIWEKALIRTPSIIFLDECEAIFGIRGGGDADHFTTEITNVFLPYLDGDKRTGNALFIGATNIPESIDRAILSRFEIVIPLTAPTREQREEIAVSIMKKYQVRNPSAYTTKLASLCEGRSARDIDAIVRLALNKVAGGANFGNAIVQVAEARLGQGSSSTKENLTWDDVVLKDEVTEQLKRSVRMLVNQDSLSAGGFNVQPRALLLHGPPGTGKTQIARVLASTSSCSFLAISTADVKAGYIGQSGQRVKEIFQRARMMSPCILFLDELDIITGSRDDGMVDVMTREIVGQLLQEMDGVKETPGTVFLIGATNFPDKIDQAILSRFTERIHIPLPNQAERAKMVLQFLSKMKVFGSRDEISLFVSENTKDKSGRDIRSIMERAEQRAAERFLESDESQGPNTQPPTMEGVALQDFAKII